MVTTGLVDELPDIPGVRQRWGRDVLHCPYCHGCDVLVDLGLTSVGHPRGVGDHLEADPTGLTTVAGVWVAGNVTDLVAQVIGAAAAGVKSRRGDQRRPRRR